jgi:hypothetical protein
VQTITGQDPAFFCQRLEKTPLKKVEQKDNADG